MLYYLFAFIHVIVCFALIFFVLIQSNKGMGLAGAFGSVGGGESLFSSGGLNILIKITIGLGVIFAVTSLSLTMVRPPASGGSLIDQAEGTVGVSLSELIQEQSGGAMGEGAAPADAIPDDMAPADSAPAEEPAEDAQP